MNLILQRWIISQRHFNIKGAMKMRLRRQLAQSLLEYSVLLALIMSALLVMQVYIKRAYQGRLKQEADSVGQQYAPGHTDSTVTTAMHSYTETVNDGGTIVVQTPVGNPSWTTVTKEERVESFGASLR